ncbi:MAG TPA: hypothetical protein VN258_08675 [Mobilitalea sp.]|nr:hypothetical protein [Mobilitalea sp.]
MEPLSDCACEGHYEEMEQEVTEYFEEKGIPVKFLANRLDFIIEAN